MKKFPRGFFDINVLIRSKNDRLNEVLNLISFSLYVLTCENKKCLFPTSEFGSNKKAKVDNSTSKSISEEIDYFLQEENLTSDLIFKKENSYPCLKKLARKIICVCLLHLHQLSVSFLKVVF